MQNLTEERTGQLIRELRLKAGWTQKELGMKIGISDKAISKWERGLSFPDITLLPRLAEVFHVSVGEIISGQQLSEPALNPEQLDDVVADTLAYSQRDSFSKVKRIFCLIFLPLIFSAMFLCADCESIWRILSSILIHIAGTASASLCLLKKGKKPLWTHHPKWIYLGGAIGVCTTVFQCIAAESMSITSVVALGLLGQTIASLFIGKLRCADEKRLFPQSALTLCLSASESS